jgi:hypothetical protein
VSVHNITGLKILALSMSVIQRPSPPNFGTFVAMSMRPKKSWRAEQRGPGRNGATTFLRVDRRCSRSEYVGAVLATGSLMANGLSLSRLSVAREGCVLEAISEGPSLATVLHPGKDGARAMMMGRCSWLP